MRSSNKIKVVHVAAQLATGGMERLLADFARHADRDRFSLEFISLGDVGSVGREIQALGWPVTALEMPSGLRPREVLRLRRHFRTVWPDVVHTHNVKPLFYAVPAARLARVPAVLYTRHGQRYGARWRENAGFRCAAHMVDKVVCVSHDSERLSVAEGVPQRKATTIWNGVDTSRFDYQGPRPDGPVVMVGRMDPVKNVDVLLRAAAQIAARDPRFRLQIAGDGACLAGWKQLASDLALGESVTFLGEVRDVPGLLSNASMLVLPSKTEGLSLTLLEAAARGLPIIATNVGGNGEVVVDGHTGYLVPANDPTPLAVRIRALMRMPRVAREMGLRGRERVLKHFDIAKMMRSYESLYLDLLASRQGGQEAQSSRARRDGAAPSFRRRLPVLDEGAAT